VPAQVHAKKDADHPDIQRNSELGTEVPCQRQQWKDAIDRGRVIVGDTTVIIGFSGKVPGQQDLRHDMVLAEAESSGDEAIVPGGE
jgi:hypothetical protein